MSSNFIYPDLTPQLCRNIEIIRRLHADNHDYLSHSPYDESLRKFIRGWFDKEITENPSVVEEKLMGDDKWETLYTELVQLFADLKNSKPASIDTSESMSYFKTMVSLSERLLSYQERSLGIKQVHEFHNEVIRIMEDVLSADQRNEVVERLKKSIQAV